jgi:tryptophan synthase alpha chain
LSPIADAFASLKREGKKGFIPFITAGDPDLETTCELLIELSNAGATLIELGVPFSDPMADGPVIQRASERALRHGFGVKDVIETAAKAREITDVPIVLFSYFNPLLQYGFEKLSAQARDAGVDGILVTDLIAEESDVYRAALDRNKLDMIFLAAPTSTDARLEMIAQRARGFIYAVSRSGVTGKREDLSGEAEKLVGRIRKFSDLPVAVGFGISTREQVQQTWGFADAAVVGSAIVAEIEKLSGLPDLVKRIGEFARTLAHA